MLQNLTREVFRSEPPPQKKTKQNKTKKQQQKTKTKQQQQTNKQQQQQQQRKPEKNIPGDLECKIIIRNLRYLSQGEGERRNEQAYTASMACREVGVQMPPVIPVPSIFAVWCDFARRQTFRRLGTSATTGWLGVTEIASMTCNVALSVTARKIVKTEASPTT